MNILIGSLDEASYNKAKTASKVIEKAGIAGTIFSGSSKDQDIGGAAWVGGAIADEAVGKGYRYTLKFSCN